MLGKIISIVLKCFKSNIGGGVSILGHKPKIVQCDHFLRALQAELQASPTEQRRLAILIEIRSTLEVCTYNQPMS